MIFVVMATSGCHCKEKKARRFQPIDVSIYILSGDNAQTLHCIQYHRYTCALHSCPVNYMPVLSVCGSRMAILLNDLETSIDHVQVYKLPTAGDLQNRCRICILQSFPPDIIPKLPLPTRLISYLQFKPECIWAKETKADGLDPNGHSAMYSCQMFELCILCKFTFYWFQTTNEKLWANKVDCFEFCLLMAQWL